jgi:aromatic-L-amino-acid decarboxylase
MGKNNLRIINTDETFAMRPDLLRSQIEQDIQDGLTPAFVCATVGTTSSTALDPLEAIGKICKEFDIWLHVDAAMAGPAALCPEYRFIHEGIEYADSYTFNPHKWMLTNFDCSVFYVADRKMLIDSLSILPEYLKTKETEAGAVFDYRDWGIPLGRRFRALKLWHVINYYGVEGLQEYMRGHVANTQQLKMWIEEDDRFEVMAPVPLNLICFRHKNGDAFNERLLNELNASGQIYLTHTKLNDQYVIRLSVGQATTTLAHLKRSWELIVNTAEGLNKG